MFPSWSAHLYTEISAAALYAWKLPGLQAAPKPASCCADSDALLCSVRSRAFIKEDAYVAAWLGLFRSRCLAALPHAC
jgi:hypothetical protein